MLSTSNPQRALVALVQVLGLSVWFAAAAVVPSLHSDWGIGVAAAAWLTIAVQIGFVVGAITSAVFNLADRIAPQCLLAASALGAAACTTVLAIVSTGLETAIPLRFLTGLLLAGVYPVGMKLMASWAGSTSRGRLFGVLIGALTVGSALPHLISGLGPLPWRSVLLAAAALSTAAAAIAVGLIRPGPHLDVRTVARDPKQAIAVFVERGPRLVILGYLGHMWELYALWTWLPLFVLVGREQRGEDGFTATGLVTFVAIGVAGAGGCLLGGWASDRFQRAPVAVAALVISAACCLLSPLFFAGPTVVLVAFLVVWGAAVIADSGVFSTVLSETTDPRFVGTALTAQTAAGFLLTVVSIQLIPLVAGVVGWQYAFLILALGPLIGAAAMSAPPVRQYRKSKEENTDDHHAYAAVRRSDGTAFTHSH
jgi:MFS family permease